jgi:DNA-binding response OmpR family regulator
MQTRRAHRLVEADATVVIVDLARASPQLMERLARQLDARVSRHVDFATAASAPDLVILHVARCGAAAVKTVQRVRHDLPEARLLVWAMRATVKQRIAVLEAGADRCVRGSAEMEEVTAQAQALLRRALRGRPPRPLGIGDLRLDRERRVAVRGEDEVMLTNREVQILAYLIRRPGETIRRDALRRHIWAVPLDTEGNTNVIDVHITYLRRKLRALNADSWLRTVRGAGYCLRPADVDSQPPAADKTPPVDDVREASAAPERGRRRLRAGRPEARP